MNFSTNVAVTAVVLLVASAGVLFPLHGSISELETDLVSLETQADDESAVPNRISEINQDLAQLEESQSSREFTLCPDTPEARNQFETLLNREIQSAGLSRISMDRQVGYGVGGTPSFNISLVIEGDAFELHTFLRGLESIEWLTRVLKLEIQPGDTERRIKMLIAVLLEDGSES